MKVKIEELNKLVFNVISTKFDKDVAEKITEIILFAELSGKTTHGLSRIIGGPTSIFAQNSSQKPEIIQITKQSYKINGYNNPAMFVGYLAMEKVIETAKAENFGLVGTFNTNSTSGCLSFYLEKIAQAGLIGLIMARSPQSIAPEGVIEPLMGTNPIGFAFPSEGKPLIFDMSTSAISYGAIIKADKLKQKLPEGIVTDNKGEFTTDPKEGLDGTILPFDRGYKGFGLAMMVEILAGVWTSAGYIDKNEEGGWGNSFLVFKPELLMDREDFRKRISAFINRVKQSKTKDGNSPRIVGEDSRQNREANLKKGYIDIEEELINELQKILN